MYPSVPQLLVTALQAQFPGARVVTELPYDLAAQLPAIQVTRFGGAGDVLSMDVAFIDLDIWDETLEGADVLASQVRAWMRIHLPGHRVTGPSGTGVFSACKEQTSAMRRPSGNVDIKRVGGAFTVHVHSA